jgi:D-sedoheptulose 7-phosphate isomerase
MQMISDDDLHRVLSDSLKESAELKLRLLDLHAGTILEWTKAIAQCIHQGNKLIAFGNGGSAADAQHIVAELVGRYMEDRKALAALALTGNASVLTGIANDYGFEAVFSRQIEALGRADDIALAISTSGRSRNVILGAQAARKIGIKVLALTGQGQGPLNSFSDSVLDVPSTNVARIQECHTAVAHVLCELLDMLVRAGI